MSIKREACDKWSRKIRGICTAHVRAQRHQAFGRSELVQQRPFAVGSSDGSKGLSAVALAQLGRPLDREILECGDRGRRPAV